MRQFNPTNNSFVKRIPKLLFKRQCFNLLNYPRYSSKGGLKNIICHECVRPDSSNHISSRERERKQELRAISMQYENTKIVLNTLVWKYFSAKNDQFMNNSKMP